MKYCENCGAPIKFMEKHVCPNAAEAPAKTGLSQQQKILIGVAAAVIVAAIVLLAVFGGSGKTDPFDYTTVLFEGYDSAGRVSVFFDESAMLAEIIGEEPDGSDLQKYGVWLQNYDTYSSGVSYTCSPEEGLSNGDEVTVTFTVSDEASGRVKASEQTVTVSGLTEVEKINVFDNVTVTYEGVGGAASAEVTMDLDGSFFNDIRMNIEPNGRLNNGDVITVSVSNVDYLAETYQQIPSEISRQYTVSGLPEFITDASQFPVAEVQALAADYLKYVQENTKDNEIFTHTDIKLDGCYFMVPKNGESILTKRSLWIVVSYKEYMDGKFRQINYLPLKFDKPVIQTEGTLGYDWEDGSHATFFTGDSFPPEHVTEDYIVTKIG